MNLRTKLEETLASIGLDHEEQLVVVCRLGAAPFGTRLSSDTLKRLAEAAPEGPFDAHEHKFCRILLSFGRALQDDDVVLQDSARSIAANVLAVWSIVRASKGDVSPFKEQGFDGVLFDFSDITTIQEREPSSIRVREAPQALARRHLGKMKVAK